MRSALVRCFSAALVLVSLSGCDQVKSSIDEALKTDPTIKAKSRVEYVLNGAKTGVSSETEQQGIFNWYGKGAKDNFGNAYDSYHAWFKQKGLFRNISSFEILEAEVDETIEFPTVTVTVKINRGKYRISVPKDGTMGWHTGRRRR